MTHETRHGMRVVLTLFHMVIQLLLIWIIAGILDAKTTASIEELMHLNNSILTHLSIMVGVYFLYVSLLRLFTGSNKRKRS